MLALAILMTVVAVWSFIDIISSVKLVKRKSMDDNFIAVYARFFVVCSIASVALWIASGS